MQMESPMANPTKLRKELRFEGYSADEILALDSTVVDQWILTGQPAVFRIGTAQILGEFRATKDTLIVELAQIEGGGEGVLLGIASLLKRYARQRSLHTIEWSVHAVDCAKPNLKLRRVLERSGFSIHERVGSGRTFRRTDSF